MSSCLLAALVVSIRCCTTTRQQAAKPPSRRRSPPAAAGPSNPPQTAGEAAARRGQAAHAVSPSPGSKLQSARRRRPRRLLCPLAAVNGPSSEPGCLLRPPQSTSTSVAGVVSSALPIPPDRSSTTTIAGTRCTPRASGRQSICGGAEEGWRRRRDVLTSGALGFAAEGERPSSPLPRERGGEGETAGGV